MSTSFAPRTTADEIERGTAFQPKFDSHGLIPAIVTDTAGGEVLMFAFMNEETLRLTIDTGVAHFWSRSRNKIWKKGEESGNLLAVDELRTDCDQDVVWLRATLKGDGVACHTGARSCFYRKVEAAGASDGGVRLVRAPV